MSHVCALIVTYNRLEKLQLTLKKTFECGFQQVIVVDNASTDGTHEFLKSQKIMNPMLHIITLPCNEGGAGGFYAGLEYIKNLDHKPTWCCLYDDDAYPITPLVEIQSILTSFERSDVGMVASAVYLPSGQISEMNRVTRNPYKSIRTFLKAVTQGRQSFIVSDSDYKGPIISIDIASFVGCFINVQNMIRAGVNIKKDMFIYCDDVLFTFELTEKRLTNYFAPTIKFLHDSYSFNSDLVYSPLWKVYYIYRNNLYVFMKLSKFLFPAVFVKVILQWILRGRHYGSAKNKYYRLMLIAILDFLTLNFKRQFSDIQKLT